MEKILTVSIAAYNVEKYIEKTLDSCIVEDIMEQLEVIVVNDGSKDRTAQIAQKYVDKWPGTFRLIDKANGGYGSTVNAGIKAASGKYFRLLDGDDWFDGEELRKFIHTLETATEDMIVAKFKRVFEEDGHIEERDETKDIHFESGSFEQIDTKDWFTMHAVSYKTDILKNNSIELTEHCFYTDQEYDLLPLRWVETVRFVPFSVYCYRIGRGEQSVSPEGVEKHYLEQTKVLKRIYSIYSDSILSPKSAKDRYIARYVIKRTKLQIWNYVLISKSKQHKAELMEFVDTLKKEYPEIYKGVLNQSRGLKAMILSRYLLYGFMHDHRVKKYRF